MKNVLTILCKNLNIINIESIFTIYRESNTLFYQIIYYFIKKLLN
jgi:hypothetical protein